MSEGSPQPKVKHGTVWKHRPEWWRWLLAVYFAVYTYIVAQGLFPLPDEPNRIKFWPLALTVLGAVFALQILVNRARVFYLALLGFLVLSYFRLEDRIRFLEMMLEPFQYETWLRYSHFAAVLLLTPWVWRSFPEKPTHTTKEKPVLFSKGIPF